MNLKTGVSGMTTSITMTAAQFIFFCFLNNSKGVKVRGGGGFENHCHESTFTRVLCAKYGDLALSLSSNSIEALFNTWNRFHAKKITTYWVEYLI
jgi:hypothetical protein